MNDFFKGFNFDTLLAIISCVTGIVALFLGNKAYQSCKRFNKSFNDKKKYTAGSMDNSQKAAGDIINNNCDVNAIATLTSANFSVALETAYKTFELQAESNLKKVIEETSRIVNEKKLELSGYTKIDWINIYFESAKNAADTYMQKIWAQVLVRELEVPGSFGYKTLDVLKNMSREDFELFEKLCSVQVDMTVIRGNAYEKHGLKWLNCIKLSELGLLSLDDTQRTIEVEPKSSCYLSVGKYMITIRNNLESVQKVEHDVFILTYAAMELLGIIEFAYSERFVQDYIEDLKKYLRPEMDIEYEERIRTFPQNT